MKRIVLLISFIAFSGYAQVGVGTTTPESTFDVVALLPTGTSSTVDGILIPRVDRQRAQSMAGITASTLVYVNSIATGTATGTAVNISSTGFYYYDGSVWQKITTTANTSWNLSGNTLTTPGTDFLGTTDAVDLRIKTAGTDRWNISNSNSGQLQSYSLGSAGAPVYSFQGDQNTGIYSSGADALDFSTGGTSRMGIDSAGNVGIGTVPTASTILDMSSITNKALEVPNVALAATTTATLSSPATGAMVYNTATAGSGSTAVFPGYYYWNGSAWISMSIGGQNSATTFSSAGVTITAAAAFTLIPGLTTTITVPVNCTLLVTADVGISTNSTSATGYSATDVALIVDGATLTNGGYRRIYCNNNVANQFTVQHASMSQALTLTAGSHSIALYAAGAGVGASSVVGGNNTSVLQGELTVTFIKK
ncbi:MAG: hypothetical protein QM710_05695 [Flavobacterium sp.]